MAATTLGRVLRHLRGLAGGRAEGDLTDAELLEHFRHRHEEAAFALLVQRHGPMVLGVCRRVLGNAHDAEDAFQATFLVLARSAASVRKQDSLGSFLYGVAYRVAARARARDARRRTHERREVDVAGTQPLDEMTWQELRAVLDEELDGLPPKYRAPVVLCYLEGKTHEQAARELGWPKTSLSSRLARARELLRGRLTRRGLALSASTLAAALAQNAAPAAVPALLTLAASRAARLVVTGKPLTGADVSARAAGLADAVGKGLMAGRLKLLTAVLLVLGAATSGAALLARRPPAADPPPAATRDTQRPQDSRPVPVDNQGDPLPPGAVARLGTIRFRHDDWVGSFSCARDGRTLVSTAAGALYIWDARTGKGRRLTLAGLRPAGPVDQKHCVACSPDGRLLAVRGEGGSIELRETATGKVIRRLPGHTGRTPRGEVVLLGLLFSPDGATLFSHGTDPKPRRWDVATGKELRQFPGGEGLVRAIALSPDGKVLAAAVGDYDRPGEIRLWEVATGRPLRRLSPGTKIYCLAFSPDGKVLAVGGGGNKRGFIHRWDAVTGKELAPLPEHAGVVFTLAFSPDGKSLVSGSNDRTIRRWDLTTGKEVWRARQERTPVYQVRFSPDGKAIVWRGAEHALLFLDPATGKELPRPEGHHSAVMAVAVSADGRLLATGSSVGDATARVWDRATRKEVQRFQGLDGYITAVAFSPDGKALAWGNSEGPTCLGEIATGKVLRRFGAPRTHCTCLAFAPDGRFVAGWCEGDRTLRLWDAATGKEVRHWAVPPGFVRSLAFSPDGRTLAAGSGVEVAVHLWDVDTGKEVRSIGPQLGGIHAVAFSADGRSLAVATVADKNAVQIWEVESGRVRQTLPHGRRAAAAAFSPDGRLLATGYEQIPRDAKTDASGVLLWDLAPRGEGNVPRGLGNDPVPQAPRPLRPSGKQIHRFTGHRGAITSLAFTPDGKTLASGSQDTTALLWDVASLRAARPQVAPLTAAELEAKWADLANADAGRAYRALCSLAADPEPAVKFLAGRLAPAAAADPGRVARLLADLDGDDFAVRQRASRELAGLGESAAPALRKALAGKPSPEVRHRIELLLKKLGGDRELRTVRAVEVLERIRTPAARRLLEKLAAGEPGARLTREAKAALLRFAGPTPRQARARAVGRICNPSVPPGRIANPSYGQEARTPLG